MANIDPAVFAAGAIFQEHGEFILKILRRQAGNGLDVEDLYQDFYLALVRRPIGADVRDVQGYLYRALVHHVISAARVRGTRCDNMKKYARRTEISINNHAREDAFIADEHQNAVIARLGRCLQGREAQAFVMRYRDRCSILEIATRMGINKRTVNRYLSEAVRKLQRRLAPE